ncbi:helix-turn-helix domain-containing protein [Vibrio parahaemolyticus]|uniref:helix-turn-helix domain-containing protein n=1 Tax=Vibrio parahaemolyticus TaxID=670 RepID=UPI000419C4F0|nr:helix-turn-helix domain-containing protein [Vibrio parahaemolyticus]
MMTTEEWLYNKYGNSPLLSFTQVAEILHRSPEGLRITLRTNCDLANKLKPNRLKIGRRVYFKVSDIANLIGQSTPDNMEA